MSGAAFTPGPWAVEDNEGAYVKEPGLAQLRIEERSSPSEFVIALIVTDVSPLEKRAHANANLIASAPELYDALQALTRRVLEGGTVHNTSPLIRIACETLARARGEA